MSQDTRTISQVGFEDGGLVIQYQDSEEIRVGGRVAIARQIAIAGAHPDYREDMEGLYRKAQRLLSNVLEDFEDSVPYIPVADDDDEDDDTAISGMGDR